MFLIGILTHGMNFLCFNLLSSTMKSISFEIPKKFKAVVAFAGAPYPIIKLFLFFNFFNQFDAKIFRSEKIDTHGESLRVYIKKDTKVKIETSVKKMLKEEENFGIKDYQTYQKFGEKVYKIRENVLNNLKNLKKRNKKIIGYGAPAKATTALNFFGISTDIDFIVEDNKLKHNKFIPGVKIPIKNKSAIKNKKNDLLVLAWNFYKEIKKNNSDLSDKFVNIKELETNNWKQDF